MPDQMPNIFTNYVPYLQKGKIPSTSKAARKMWAFIEDRLQTRTMVEKIKSIRLACQLPEEGFVKDEDYKKFAGSIFDDKHQLDRLAMIQKAAKYISKELDVNDYPWINVIAHLILTGKLEEPKDAPDHLVQVFDIHYPPFSDPDKPLPANLRGIGPVLISVDPYATQNQITEHVKAVHNSLIKPIQDKYKNPSSKIGKIRPKKSSTKELYDFIYSHRNKNRGAIRKLVGEKFRKPFGDNDISKIISIVKQRKQEL